MSVTAEIETRSRTNVLAVPIASVTTRVIKPKASMENSRRETNSVRDQCHRPRPAAKPTPPRPARKADEKNKPVDVVFVVEGDHVKMVPVKIGISDDNYWEITDGLKEGEEIVSGGYSAISRDLDDGKKIVKRCRPATPKSPENREPHPTPENFAPLPDGRGNGPRVARSFARNPARRIRRHHGAVRLGQIHVDESARLPRHADRRQLRTERHPGQRDGRQPARRNPQPRNRVCVSNLQPAAALRCVAQCRTAADLFRHFVRRNAGKSRWKRWPASGWPTAFITSRTNFPAASASASPSPARS